MVQIENKSTLLTFKSHTTGPQPTVPTSSSATQTWTQGDCCREHLRMSVATPLLRTSSILTTAYLNVTHISQHRCISSSPGVPTLWQPHAYCSGRKGSLTSGLSGKDPRGSQRCFLENCYVDHTWSTGPVRWPWAHMTRMVK